MPDDTGRHHLDALHPPPPDEANGRGRRRRRRTSPLPWHREPSAPPPAPDFADVPTAVRPLAQALYEPLHKACTPPKPPWWRATVLGVALGAVLTLAGWAASTLLGASESTAVHDVQIEGLSKRVDRIEGKVDQVLEELRRR